MLGSFKNIKRISGGYELRVIDSNFSDIQTYDYLFGDNSISYEGFGHFVPYTEEQKEEGRLNKIRTEYCGHP